MYALPKWPQSLTAEQAPPWARAASNCALSGSHASAEAAGALVGGVGEATGGAASATRGAGGADSAQAAMRRTTDDTVTSLIMEPRAPEARGWCPVIRAWRPEDLG